MTIRDENLVPSAFRAELELSPSNYSVTVSVVLPTMPPDEAEMVVEPMFTGVASPVERDANATVIAAAVRAAAAQVPRVDQGRAGGVQPGHKGVEGASPEGRLRRLHRADQVDLVKRATADASVPRVRRDPGLFTDLLVSPFTGS